MTTTTNSSFDCNSFTSSLKKSNYLSTENIISSNNPGTDLYITDLVDAGKKCDQITLESDKDPLTKINSLSKEDYPKSGTGLFIGGRVLDDNIGNKYDQVTSESDVDLLTKIDRLSKELHRIKEDYSKSQKSLLEFEQRYATDIELFSQQLQKSNKESETLKQKSDVSYLSELQKLVNKCCEKDLELQCLKEIIVSLEQQITKLQENVSNGSLFFYCIFFFFFC